MKVFKLFLVILMGFGLFATNLNSADFEIPNDFEHNVYEVYVIHRNRVQENGLQYYTVHLFMEDDSWNNLWQDVVGDENDFFNLTIPHNFIVRVRDDFDADYLPSYNDEDNTLRYPTDSAENIPFGLLKLAQIPAGNPAHANFVAHFPDGIGRFADRTGPIADIKTIIMEVE